MANNKTPVMLTTFFLLFFYRGIFGNVGLNVDGDQSSSFRTNLFSSEIFKSSNQLKPKPTKNKLRLNI